MKQILLAGYMLIIGTTVNAQFYLSLGAQTKGATLGTGVLYKHIDMSFLYDTPFDSKTDSKSISLNVGRQIMLSNWGEDDFSITPLIGIGKLYSKNFTILHNDYRNVIVTKSTKMYPVYGLEIGENIFSGRFSVIYKFIEKSYLGIAVRVSFNKLYQAISEKIK